VAKPFSPRELVARVRSILRRAAKAPGNGPLSTTRSPTQPTTQATTQPIVVDEGRRQIRFYGALLELSRYEFGLLQTLASRPGHVYSRDALLERVWGGTTESMDRTVDAHVKTVRAKMKLIAPGLDPIRTHRGSGYCLVEDLPATPPEA
jgi:two-component system, OmpR family, catabolic regulation response regulator CreB